MINDFRSIFCVIHVHIIFLGIRFVLFQWCRFDECVDLTIGNQTIESNIETDNQKGLNLITAEGRDIKYSTPTRTRDRNYVQIMMPGLLLMKRFQ